jgi:hypothetical protein
MSRPRRAHGEVEWRIATGPLVAADRRARLEAVTIYVQHVFEQVEARLAAGETAAVAYPEALRHELERLRRATE